MKQNTDKNHPKSLDEFLEQIREEAYCKTELGSRFEKFVKAYLLSDFFGIKFTDVWLWNECPYSHGHDIGIDLVARDTFGDFHAVQCKCYAPGTSVSMEDVSQFLAASGKTFIADNKSQQYVSRILVSTSDSFSSNAEIAIQDQNPPVTRIGLADLKKTITDAGFFDFEKNKAVIRKLEERPHQTAAIADVVGGFQNADLKKQLPRLPLPKDMPTFKKVMKIGRELASLHLNYEDVEPWDLDEVKTGSKVSFRVDKLRFGKKGADEDRSVIVVNPTLSLKGIPQQAYDYVVNGRSALEWIIDRYQIRTDKDSGIVNDPNKWGEEHDNPRYIVDLIEKVVRVSVESAKLIAEIDDGEGRASSRQQNTPFVYSEDLDQDLPMAAEESGKYRAEDIR